jgi:hypothetical protein
VTTGIIIALNVKFLADFSGFSDLVVRLAN